MKYEIRRWTTRDGMINRTGDYEVISTHRVLARAETALERFCDNSMNTYDSAIIAIDGGESAPIKPTVIKLSGTSTTYDMDTGANDREAHPDCDCSDCTKRRAVDSLAARGEVKAGRDAERAIIQEERRRENPTFNTALCGAGAWMLTREGDGIAIYSTDWPEGFTAQDCIAFGYQAFRLDYDGDGEAARGYYYDTREAVKLYDGDTCARPLDDYGIGGLGAVELWHLVPKNLTMDEWVLVIG